MKNSTGRRLLEQSYGKGCFMERAAIRIVTEEEEQKLKKKIKGYKKLNRQITYHHIKEKHLGGEVSLQNGANIAAYNYEWLHRQPPEVIEEINNKLQEFKLSIDIASLKVGDKDIELDKIGSVDLELDTDDVITIPVYNNTQEDEIRRKNKFNRAKVKEETKHLIEEELYR